MGNYKKILNDYKKRGNFSEDKMWVSVDVLDDVILSKLEEKDPELYWDFMRDQHEIFCGPHFDEKFGKWEIEQMMHKDEKGNVHKGEHWGASDVKGVFEKYRGKLRAGVTMWDVAVALNANWHDKVELWSKWWAQGVDEKIIEDAIHFYFMDDDAPDGKVWLYMRAMAD